MRTRIINLLVRGKLIRVIVVGVMFFYDGLH